MSTDILILDDRQSKSLAEIARDAWLRTRQDDLGPSYEWEAVARAVAWQQYRTTSNEYEEKLQASAVENECLREHIRLLLPLAKGYSAPRPQVTSNREIIDSAENAINEEASS